MLSSGSVSSRDVPITRLSTASPAWCDNSTARTTLLVALAVITTILAIIAITQQLLPGLIISTGVGGLTFAAVWYSSKNSFQNNNTCVTYALPIVDTPLPAIARSDCALSWDERLNTKPDRRNRGLGNFYNLDDPAKPFAQYNHLNHLMLPNIAKYERGFVPKHRMVVRLPKDKLSNFPQEIRDRYQDEENLELFFIVYRDEQSEHLDRNLSMHVMALPEYQPSERFQRTYMRAKICDAHGVDNYPIEKHAIPLIGEPKEFEVIIHEGIREGRQGTEFSPNTARFMIKPGVDVPSFYVTAKFRGKTVACHALILKNPDSADGLALQNAMMDQPTIIEFLGRLGDSETAEKIRQTFR